jgi:glycosyltransferase involved in cell wall biosynthesis
VESVLRQTFRNFEIIIVDDGSTDIETLRILDDLVIKYPEITVIHQPNGHLANARNNGIVAAKGEYILPLDADDLLEPTILEKCVAVLDSDSSVGFAYVQARLFGDRDEIWVSQEYDFYDLLLGNNYIVATNLYRRQAWEQVGGYDESMREGYEDWEFLIRLGKIGWRGKFIPEPLFLYRKHGTSMIDWATDRHDRLVKYIREKHSDIYGEERVKVVLSLKQEIRELRARLLVKERELQENEWARKNPAHALCKSFRSKLEFALFHPLDFLKKYTKRR